LLARIVASFDLRFQGMKTLEPQIWRVRGDA
jgi:hypothetical protein